jgi:hypothetical protein
MIRISIAEAGFAAIAETLPFGSTPYEAKRSADGQNFIWLERLALDRLDALLPPGRGLQRGHSPQGANRGLAARTTSRSEIEWPKAQAAWTTLSLFVLR